MSARIYKFPQPALTPRMEKLLTEANAILEASYFLGVSAAEGYLSFMQDMAKARNAAIEAWAKD